MDCIKTYIYRDRDIMFLDRLEVFLKETCHVEAKDVPAIVATFVTAKYFVWTGFVVAGARFKPISNFLLKRVMPKVAESVRQSNSHVAKQAVRARKEFVSGLKEQKYGTRGKNNIPTDTFLVRLGRQYQYYSERLGERVATNRTWRVVSGWIKQDPRHLAVGIAEGMIFYKIMIPVHIPLTLYGIIQYYQIREETEDERQQQPVGYHGGENSEQDVVAIIGDEGVSSSSSSNRDDDESIVGVLVMPTLRSLQNMATQEQEETVFEDLSAIKESAVGGPG